ncbi:hypothetical protein BLNAU_950 [Blattamonas nauphoetae]|uniref:Uncharacterized protein n=1 Tax=Blattamonas nauphoetae TaxID=2049346 RepID=A0ABQ9YJE3_9EUKA|nr:hypothetical protein BLNAU_950 [Blattamonas nauphoetae]
MSNSDVSGMDESTEFLFHLQNSTISFDNLNFIVSGESRIANLLDSSHVQISCALLSFESENIPITTDLGTVALLNITLRGYSLLPEILESSSPDSHLLVSQCLCDDVIVGSSPLFGCSTYTAEITQSSFSNIDHVVTNQYYYPTKTLCATDPSKFQYTTNFAESTMRNVTDDIYGSITNAPISGNSFMLRDLQSIQQTVKTDVLQSNKKANETVVCAITKKYTVQNYKFVNGSDPYSTGYLGLVISIYAPAITLTVSSCSFDGLSSQGVAGLSISSLLSSSDPTDAPKVSIKSCKFVNLNGWSFLSIYPLDNNCTISKCSMISCTASRYCVGISHSVSNIQNIELRISGCGFQSCRSYYDYYPGFVIDYSGTVVFDKQTVFEDMSFRSTGLRVRAPSIKFTQTRLSNCYASVDGSTVELYADTILVEDVHLKKNRGTCSPSQLFITLTQNYYSSEGHYVTLNRIYVEKSTSTSLYDIVVAVPETLLTSGHLNKQWVTELNADSNRNIIASTYYETEISPSFYCGRYDGLLTDETYYISQIGEDPRKDKSKLSMFDTPDGSNGVVIALTTSLPVTLIIVVGIVAGLIYGFATR